MILLLCGPCGPMIRRLHDAGSPACDAGIIHGMIRLVKPRGQDWRTLPSFPLLWPLFPLRDGMKIVGSRAFPPRDEAFPRGNGASSVMHIPGSRLPRPFPLLSPAFRAGHGPCPAFFLACRAGNELSSGQNAVFPR